MAPKRSCQQDARTNPNPYCVLARVRSYMSAYVWMTRPCLRVDIHVNSLREVFPSLYIYISLGDVPFYADRPEEKNWLAGRQKLQRFTGLPLAHFKFYVCLLVWAVIKNIPQMGWLNPHFILTVLEGSGVG